MQCFVINLADDHARRASMTGQLEALDLRYRLFPAVDGRALSEEALAQHYDPDTARVQYRALSAGEIGCALSHLGVYRAMVSEGIGHALILEDDARLGLAVPEVLGRLEAAYSSEENTVVLLSYVDKYTRWGRRALGDGFQVVKPYQHSWRAHGYVVTLAAARSMAAALYPVWSAADFWKRFDDRGIVQVRAVVPYCIGLADLSDASNLETERAINAEAGRRHDLLFYLHRYLYRRLVYQIAVRPFLRVKRQPKSW